MITILALALKSTLILGGALLLCRLRVWSAAERHLLLLIAVSSLPVLVLLEQLPDRTLSVTAPAVVTAWELSFEAPAFETDPLGASQRAPAPFSINSSAAVIYVAGAAYFLVFWLVRLCNTGRWIGRTRALAGDRVPDDCAVPLRVSERIDSPLTWGILAPEIVLPERWYEWPVEKRQAVLVHELAHVRRRDTLTCALSGLVCCLFWMHPLVWITHRRLRMEAERACDDAVLGCGYSAIAYAELLLEIVRGRDIGAALAIVSPSTLPTRIRALLDPAHRRAPMNRFRMYAVVLLAIILVAPLASVDAVGGLEEHPEPLSSDTDLHPRVKVGAVYPKEARDQNIEGYVLVEFTVTESGETADARVIESDPPGVFESTALQAVGRYRYQPRVVDGEAVAVSGIRNRIVFDLENGGDSDEALTTRLPDISEATYSKLTAVQSFIDEEDFEAARTLIERLKTKAHQMNGNELAQVHNMAGFVDFSTDDYWGAVTEYEQVLAQGEAVPRGLRTQTLYTLAQLNFVNEEYQASLKHIRQWREEASNPSPVTLIFMAQVYYRLSDYPAAIKHLNAGLDQARDRDVEIRENWWALLGYLYSEEERWSDAASVLEILNRDFPRERYANRLREVRDILAGEDTGGA